VREEITLILGHYLYCHNITLGCRRTKLLTIHLYFNASTFTGTATVPNEWYNLTNTDENTTNADGISTPLTFDQEVDTSVQIDATTLKNLWLKIYATKSGTATSTFKVLGEGT
jgi:hypothetical protein